MTSQKFHDFHDVNIMNDTFYLICSRQAITNVLLVKKKPSDDLVIKFSVFFNFFFKNSENFHFLSSKLPQIHQFQKVMILAVCLHS